MKKLFRIMRMLLVMTILPIVALGQTGNYSEEFINSITINTPQPYLGKSLQERSSFDAISISPEIFIKSIKQSQSEASIFAYLQSLGLPVDSDTASFVYCYKKHVEQDEFLLPQDSRYMRVASVSFVYSEEANDNYTFLFVQDHPGAWYLVDGIDSFGEICTVTDLSGNNTWLIGYNGTQNRTARWYHLQSNSMVLAYLEQGVWADSVNYHIYVKSHIDIPANFEVSENTPITLCKQVSIVDYTDIVISVTANEKLLYTQIDQYMPTDLGPFDLISSIKK